MTKRIMIWSLILSCTLFLLSATPSKADIIYNLNFVYSGASPAGPSPWLTATFEDISTGVVKLTLSAAGLTGSEFVDGTTNNNPQSGWYFNLDPLKDPTKLNFSFVSGNRADGIFKGIDKYSAGPDGKYDILFAWRPNQPGGTLSAGEQAVYDITYTGGNLEASWFDYLSQASGPLGTYHTAAHVQGILQPPGSGWIGDGGTAVPEPATMLLLGSGLIGLAGFARKKFRK